MEQVTFTHYISWYPYFYGLTGFSITYPQSLALRGTLALHHCVWSASHCITVCGQPHTTSLCVVSLTLHHCVWLASHYITMCSQPHTKWLCVVSLTLHRCVVSLTLHDSVWSASHYMTVCGQSHTTSLCGQSHTTSLCGEPHTTLSSPLGKTQSINWTGGWMGQRFGLEALQKWKISWPCQEPNINYSFIYPVYSLPTAPTALTQLPFYSQS
jgi:hypothetical protein